MIAPFIVLRLPRITAAQNTAAQNFYVRCNITKSHD